MEALWAAAEDEIEKKDKVILELYENLQNLNEGQKGSDDILKKTERFLKDPENVITVDFGKKQKQDKKNKNLNKSF